MLENDSTQLTVDLYNICPLIVRDGKTFNNAEITTTFLVENSAYINALGPIILAAGID